MKNIKKIILVVVILVVIILLGIIVHDIIAIRKGHEGDCCSCCKKGEEVCITACCPCKNTILLPDKY